MLVLLLVDHHLIAGEQQTLPRQPRSLLDHQEIVELAEVQLTGHNLSVVIPDQCLLPAALNQLQFQLLGYLIVLVRFEVGLQQRDALGVGLIRYSTHTQVQIVLEKKVTGHIAAGHEDVVMRV